MLTSSEPNSGQPIYHPNDFQFFQYTPFADQATTLPQAFNTMTFQDPGNKNWFMDTGATAHLNNDAGILNSVTNKCNNFFVLVRDGVTPVVLG